MKRLLREPGHPSSLLLLVQSAGHRWGISRASTPFRTVDETTEVKQVVAADRERWFITKKIDNRGSTDGPVKGISGCLLLSAPVVVTNSSGLVSRFDRNNHTVDRNFDIVELVAPDGRANRDVIRTIRYDRMSVTLIPIQRTAPTASIASRRPSGSRPLKSRKHTRIDDYR